MLLAILIFSPFQGAEAQIRLDSLFQKPSKTVRVPEQCEDLEVDGEGNILLLSPRKHKLHKLFRNTGYDSVLTIGGKGIGKEGFNMPIQIDAPNRQNVYVLDDQNRRIAILNVNLKILDDLNFLTLESNVLSSGPEYLWVVGFACGPSGELYLLNQEDNKIYKFNNFRELETSFGGMDYGAGILEDPEEICINDRNFLFISNPSVQKVVVFDLYGVFQYNLKLDIPFKWKRIALIGPYLVYFDESNLFFYNLTSKKTRHIPYPGPGKIRDIDGNKDFFYLLDENGVNLYAIKAG